MPAEGLALTAAPPAMEPLPTRATVLANTAARAEANLALQKALKWLHRVQQQLY
jgi:hypothetical protein